MSHVLIVDDHEENLTLLDTILRSNGYPVTQATNGAEALQAARAEPPELIISDIFMPVMDGFALCREWNRDERLRQIPFVFYTATYTDSRDEELGLSLGAVRFLVKGMEPEAFVAALRQVLQEHAAGRLAAPRAPAQEEAIYYRLYNEALVRKLEDKMLALEAAKQTLEQDIADRKRAEEALRHAHERLRCFVDANVVGIVIASPSGGVIEANDYYLRTIGYTREEFERGKVNWRAITPPEWLALDEHAIEELRDRGTCTPYEKEYVQRDGTRVSVFLSDVMLPGPDEQIAAFVLDITARKRLERERVALEAQLRQQQKLEALGTLAGGVAHEINNPISGIMNYAQLIADAVGPDSPAAGHAQEIIAETERVATIVRNLLQFARHDKQAHSPARLQDIVEQTLSLLRAVFRRDQITLTVDVPADLPVLKCRSQQLQQVLMNLLTNARDALNAKYPGYHVDKTIRITGQCFEHDGRSWLRLTVADHGPGIPPEIQARVFDPFFTTKARDKGTGLGLSISHGIVHDHHGVLHFETELGIGTHFHLDLPVENGGRFEGK